MMTTATPRRLAVALLATLLLLMGTALAQVDYQLGGKVSAEFGVAVDGTIPVAAAALELSLDGEVGQGFFPDAAFRAELFAAYDAAAGDAFSIRLGRAYVTAYLGSVDLTVGNQVVSWGSTDVMNPVDVVNPLDLSNPVRDPTSQNLAVPMIRVVGHPDGMKVDAVVIPVFVPSVIPGERWQPAPVLPGDDLPPGVAIVGVHDPHSALPEFSVKNVQFGVRATVDVPVGDGADISAMLFRGFRHLPTAGFVPLPTGEPGQLTILPLLTYDHIIVIGTDFSAAVGQFVLRGEAAYTLASAAESVSTGAGELPAPVGQSTLEAVAGIETNFPGGGPFVSLQAIYAHAFENDDTPSHNGFSTALIANHELTGRTQLQFAWLHAWHDGSGAVRPGVTHKLADALNLTAQAAIFYGGDASDYGAWRENSQLSLGLDFSF